MGPELFVYVVLTLIGLWKLAEWVAPWHGLTEAGCRVGYVYDGDTVELICADGRETARVQGLDAPETKSPGCPEELALGRRATERLRELVAQGPVEISDLGHEKYGRRLIHLRVAGEDVAGVMASEGLAVLYQGDTRPDWCAELGASR
ncbi:thermonuclease family protein [Aliigemmobacter aestuarii]|nr:thermonuclease family protein [Gemmobacter aestuarii]